MTAIADWPDLRESRGHLPDGTEYLIRVPTDWNGILLRDLDFASGVENPERIWRYQDLVARGFAFAGTARHRLRQWQYDPRREIENLDRLLGIFREDYGVSRHVLQYGCSGGGHLGLAVAEGFHERIDGTIALAAHTPVWIMNAFLDGWFTLQVLLAEYYVAAGYGPAKDLVVAGLPNDGSADPTGHGMTGALPEAWRKALDAAQKSALGRARIALAFALGQWGAWLADDTPQPALDDASALQNAMYLSACRLAYSPGGEARIMFENAAQGQQLSWNKGTDYEAALENANPAMRRAAETLYREAGASLPDDLARIAAAPRIEASSHALDFWAAAGRNVTARPEIPVIRLHMIGDYQIPYTLMLGYRDAVAANGAAEMLRIALVRATGHCNFTAAESSAAVETLLARLDTGVWPDTDPAALNARGEALDTKTEPRFMAETGYEVPRFNRTWIPARPK